MTIDPSYFFADLSLVSDSTYDAAALQEFIDSKEPELLEKLLGYELYAAFVEGIAADPVELRFADLRDGKVYEDGKVKWPGLIFTSGTAKKSLIANYVYWHYVRDNFSFTTGSSEKKTDLAINVSPDAKLVRAWNEMVNWNHQLYVFLLANADVYPEFVECCESDLFCHQNTLNL